MQQGDVYAVSPDESLSAREIEIASTYARGDTYQSIARRLNLAPSTVRTHLAAIYRKLEVSCKLQLHARIEGGSPDPDAETDPASTLSELALSLEGGIRREQALAEVLRIISRSRGDIDAVMSSILCFALDLCEAEFGILVDHHESGASRQATAVVSRDPSSTGGRTRHLRGEPAHRPRSGGREHDIVNICDVRAEKLFQTDDPLRHATAVLGGARSFGAIPMMSGDRLVGTFTICRQNVRPFDSQVAALAQTFADQSVIAIENARMTSALRAETPCLDRRLRRERDGRTAERPLAADRLPAAPRAQATESPPCNAASIAAAVFR